jgi:hypothetical protein
MSAKANEEIAKACASDKGYLCQMKREQKLMRQKKVKYSCHRERTKAACM